LIDRVLIVGLGSAGKRHLRLAREFLPRADIRVLCHRNINIVPEYADGYLDNIAQAVTFAPQLAIIANPASLHVLTAQALADSGAHLLIEKPLSNSIDGVVRLIDTCLERGLILSTGYNLRFMESLQQFRKLLFDGIIGKVLSVRCEVGQYLPSWRPALDYRNSVSAQQELGGGVLLELSHELDYLRWIFGEILWVKASLSRQSDLEISVEDSAHLVVGFLPLADSHQIVGTVNLDFIRHDTTRECTVIGDMGSLRWNGLIGEVAIYEIGANKWHVLFNSHQSSDESYLAEWSNLLASIVGLEKPLVTAGDGLRVIEIIEAARHSAASAGQMTMVEYTHQG
jgi:predicted dehydrogenase